MTPQRQPQPPARPMWTCDECGTRNEAWRRICRNCQTAARIDQCDPESIEVIAAIDAAAAAVHWWSCGSCPAANDPDFHPRSCRSCGWGRPASAQVEADAARAADIAAVVAGAPPLAADQLVALRQIFAGVRTRARAAA